MILFIRHSLLSVQWTLVKNQTDTVCSRNSAVVPSFQYFLPLYLYFYTYHDSFHRKSKILGQVVLPDLEVDQLPVSPEREKVAIIHHNRISYQAQQSIWGAVVGSPSHLLAYRARASHR